MSFPATRRLLVRDGGAETPVLIGSGSLLASLSLVLEEMFPGRPRAVLTSHRVSSLWGDHLRKSTGEHVVWIEFDDGEEAKTLATAAGIVDRLLGAGIRRDWLVIAAGGGVVGDLAGFAASIVLRGVPVIHVPTTLLAQVDSSIGGKTGVNHALGKNLIGTFHPAAAVVTDTEFLRTLNPDQLRCGLFEAFKTGVIADFGLARTAAEIRGYDRERLATIVTRSAELKSSIVSSDPRESGERRLLNYGHTLGHALERCMNYKGITHGDAVGWGIIGANAIGRAAGTTPSAVADEIDQMVLAMQPAPPPGEPGARELVEASFLDKKFGAGSRRVIVPLERGRCGVIEVGERELVAGAEAMRAAYRNR